MKRSLSAIAVILFLASCTNTKKAAVSDSTDPNACGPQTPRDISRVEGKNPIDFEAAPSYDKLNLCNIHFHKNAEHKGPDFSVYKGKGDHGGYACNQSPERAKYSVKKFGKGACKGIEAGDTIEVHWVHSSCDIKPGPTLGACLNDTCKNPKLRVETQVFYVVNDRKAPSFLDYTKLVKKNGFHQASRVPARDGAVEFLGSTTGPKYNNTCSPFRVSWSVTPDCKTVDIATVHEWCKQNDFKEDHAHGVRELVEDPNMLSPISI